MLRVGVRPIPTGRDAQSGRGDKGSSSAGNRRGGPYEGGNEDVELFAVKWPAQEEPLGAVASGFSNRLQLAYELHAFSDYFETEGPSQRDEGLHHRGVLR